MSNKIIIRPEILNDYASISLVNDLAFNRPDEGKFVKSSRNQNSFDPRLSLVAVSGEEVVGHILLFPIKIMSDTGIYPSLSLGPIAVHPSHQYQGIGGSLILTAHQNALKLGYTSVILIGHPSYYPQFGYKMATIWGLSNPWNIHNEAFMAIELVSGSLAGKAGKCVYPKAFNQVT